MSIRRTDGLLSFRQAPLSMHSRRRPIAVSRRSNLAVHVLGRIRVGAIVSRGLMRPFPITAASGSLYSDAVSCPSVKRCLSLQALPIVQVASDRTGLTAEKPEWLASSALGEDRDAQRREQLELSYDPVPSPVGTLSPGTAP